MFHVETKNIVMNRNQFLLSLTALAVLPMLPKVEERPKTQILIDGIPLEDSIYSSSKFIVVIEDKYSNFYTMENGKTTSIKLKTLAI